MSHPFARLAVVFASLSAVSCATVFSGTEQELSLDSKPSHAQFRIVSAGGGVGSTSGLEAAAGVTPAKVKLSRKSEYIIKVRAEGYQEASVKLNQSFNGWTICSYLCFVIPAAVDVVTGAMWDFKPDSFMITLQPGADPASSPATPAAAAYLPLPGPVLAQGETASAARAPLYLVLYRQDGAGALRHLVVPLVPEAQPPR